MSEAAYQTARVTGVRGSGWGEDTASPAALTVNSGQMWFEIFIQGTCDGNGAVS